MTRGKFVLLTENGMDISTEFNGDMYNNKVGHGPEVIKRLTRTKNADDLEEEVEEFNANNFKYKFTDRLTWHEDVVDVDTKEKTYYDKWFSDYLYVKNADTKCRTIIDWYGDEHIINPNEIYVLSFGKVESMVDSNGEVNVVDEIA